MAKRREKGKIPHQEWPAIRARHSGGESLASIARDYGCTGPAIRYIVNRPVTAPVPADEPLPAAPPPRRTVPAESRTAEALPRPPDADGRDAAVIDTAPAVIDTAPAAIDPELRWRVSSEIASFLAVFDSFLTENAPDRYDQLLDATDRLMRVAARTRIELERARNAQQGRERQGRSGVRVGASRIVAS